MAKHLLEAWVVQNVFVPIGQVNIENPELQSIQVILSGDAVRSGWAALHAPEPPPPVPEPTSPAAKSTTKK